MAKTKTPTKKREPKQLERDGFDLEETTKALTEAMGEKQTKVFSIYTRDETLEGTVTKMDANTKLIHIKDKYYNIHKVHFLDILSISDTEN